MPAQKERRAHPRYRIDWPVMLRQQGRGLRFSGRGHDLSRIGALVALPLSIPIRTGQRLAIELHRPKSAARPDPSPQEPEVHDARVVRVQRSASFLDGLQLVGLTFEHAAP